MGIKRRFPSLLLIHFLLLINRSHGVVGEEEDDNVLKLHSMDGNHHHDNKMDHAHDHHHHDMVMDPQARSFFLLEDFKTDRKFYTYIPQEGASKFLPRREAESIPFSLRDLPRILTRFGVASGSPQARAMGRTLAECQARPLRTETNFCATSLESMVDFVCSVFGPTLPRFGAISTARSGSRSKAVGLQNYTVLGVPVEVPAPKMVACHTEPYPYAVFYCHSTETEVKVFKVALEGDDGDDVDAVAACHMDTSEWSPGHVSFRVLGVEPGSSPVCHFFPAGHLVWVPKLN